MANLDKQLELVVDGRIGFDVFSRATRREFERMATYLMRRWVPPSWCTLEDVVQELLLGAWICMWGWQRSRGVKLSKYVVFNSMTHAKRALHKARGAKLSGSSDRNPSHIERPLSSFGQDGDGDAMAEAFLAEEPIAEARLIGAEEEVERRAARLTMIAPYLAACVTTREEIAIIALAEAGDVIGGADLLYSDPDVRLELELPSERHAEKFVGELAAVVVARFEESKAS